MLEKHEIGFVIDLIIRTSHGSKFCHGIESDSSVEDPMCRSFYASPFNFDLPKFYCIIHNYGILD
jgi:hypothetical protein